MSRLIKTRKTLLRVALVVIAIVATVSYVAWIQLRSGYENVTVEQAKELIETNPSMAILDVRTELEFSNERIEGARNIPVDKLQQRLSELNPSVKILVYCRTGNRSSRAAKILADNGWSRVYHMLGGIEDWKQSGYTVVQ